MKVICGDFKGTERIIRWYCEQDNDNPFVSLEKTGK